MSFWFALYRSHSSMLHFSIVSLIFSYTNTEFSPEYLTFHIWKQADGPEAGGSHLLLHTWPRHNSLFIGKISFGWVHSFEALSWSWGWEKMAHQLTQPHSQWGDRCWSEIRPYSRKFTDSAQGFCILFSINGQKNSTHILPLMMQSGKTLEIWSHADTATQFDAYTNVNVLTSLWKLRFLCAANLDPFSVSSEMHPLPPSSVANNFAQELGEEKTENNYIK